MAQLPKMQSPTIAEIYHSLVRSASDWRRDHLGCSLIGDPCERKLWYSFRWWRPPGFILNADGRVLRLFRHGEIEENWFISDLKAAGVTVSDGPELGKQWRASAHGGHFGGSMDAALLGLKEAPKTWHVGEFKTHNTKSFNALQKNGVRKSKPVHFAQMLIYAELFGLPRWAYLALCKDDDRLYLERGEADGYFAGELLEKARRIIEASAPPAKISEDPDYYLCRWCDFSDACQLKQGQASPMKSCRSCKKSKPILEGEGGQWVCGLDGKGIDSQAQRAGCDKYSPIGSPALPLFGG